MSIATAQEAREEQTYVQVSNDNRQPTLFALDPVKAKPAISVFGLGYVGAVTMACMAKLGHNMVGVDIDPAKIDAIQAGRSPIVEARLGQMLQDGVSAGLVGATAEAEAAVARTDITFVSVGTPTAADGGCDFTYVRAVAATIGRAIAAKDAWHLVVMRCSVPPGTTLKVMAPVIEEHSGKRLGEGFGICFNPEFLREGSAVADFFDPPKTVIGASDERAARALGNVYAPIDEDVQFTDIGTAEMVKYVDNTWHATKVTFANEVGRLCKALEIDSHKVMDIFVTDTKLNLSPYYLKPGFAFGGSCLPKEVRAMEHLADTLDLDVPLMQSLTRSNECHIDRAADMVRAAARRTGGKRVGFLGVAFKPNTDDLRESPTLEVMAAMAQEGFTVGAFDTNLDEVADVEGQFAYMRHARPHLRDVVEALPDILVPDAEVLVEQSDIVVVSHNALSYRRALARCRKEVVVIDLVRIYPTSPSHDRYQGICW